MHYRARMLHPLKADSHITNSQYHQSTTIATGSTTVTSRKLTHINKITLRCRPLPTRNRLGRLAPLAEEAE
ncbi:hypothetical protein M3J09_013308 [Ascochyta lentis]